MANEVVEIKNAKNSLDEINRKQSLETIENLVPTSALLKLVDLLKKEGAVESFEKKFKIAILLLSKWKIIKSEFSTHFKFSTKIFFKIIICVISCLELSK